LQKIGKEKQQMIINDRLAELDLSKYRLSKASGVPQATINDICNGKADLDKCSAGTLYRIAKVLGVSIEDILDSDKTEYRSSFEIFKSNICHRVKDMGDTDFMLDLLQSDKIRTLFNKQWYPEALYLLAMLDYLSRVNSLPLCTKYDDIRSRRLSKPLYPIDVLMTSEVLKSDEPMRKAEKDAIPEFRRFNIIENEVRNVV
jgi:transcriptional regulator with XRE-family HTH domain